MRTVILTWIQSALRSSCNNISCVMLYIHVESGPLGGRQKFINLSVLQIKNITQMRSSPFMENVKWLTAYWDGLTDTITNITHSAVAQIKETPNNGQDVPVPILTLHINASAAFAVALKEKITRVIPLNSYPYKHNFLSIQVGPEKARMYLFWSNYCFQIMTDCCSKWIIEERESKEMKCFKPEWNWDF